MILICKRASGELKTTSTWIRDFVQDHPDYRQDSVISDSIAHDLVMELKAIGEVRLELKIFLCEKSCVPPAKGAHALLVPSGVQ